MTLTPASSIAQRTAPAMVGDDGSAGHRGLPGNVVRVATVLLLALSGAVPFPAAVRAAEGDPASLPSVSQGECVPPSRAHVDHVSDAYARVAPAAVWPLSRGSGVTVAVVDTGVSASASGLRGAVLPGRDVTAGGRADRDCFGRGTALAAVIAARPVDDSLLTGIAPAARVLPIRVVRSDGRIPPGALAEGIRAAVDGGAGVVLVAAGTTGGSGLGDSGMGDCGMGGSGMGDAVRDALDHDVLVVAAVADDGRTTYPAGCPEALAVGGFTRAGQPVGTVTRAAGLDIVAPGEGVYSVGPTGAGTYTIGGAGAAAALVAGAAALLRSYRPELTAAQVRDRLVSTATPDPVAGAGELNLYGAITSVAPRPAAGAGAGVAAELRVPAPPHTPASTLIAVSVVGGALLAGVAGGVTYASCRTARRRRLNSRASATS